jgi:hypothetical protein
MLQWVIFAMKNLCKDNLENQACIAAMDKNGSVITSLETEFGIKLKL